MNHQTQQPRSNVAMILGLVAVSMVLHAGALFGLRLAGVDFAWLAP